jgi:hypothetical protein
MTGTARIKEVMQYILQINGSARNPAFQILPEIYF